MTPDQIFSRLWSDYAGQNPSVQKVYDLFVSKGEVVENDHIAFRTFDDPRVGIDVLAEVFLKAGYRYAGDYHFEEKKLYAKHFEIENGPRVFISQLLTSEFSPFLQDTVKQLIDQIPAQLPGSEELVFSGNTWKPISYEVYEKLRVESEYAAWVYVHGFMANHFTVSVNHLKHFKTLQEVNSLLKDNGFRINDSGGEIKGTPAELLEQSSIRSEMVHLQFLEGMKEVPGCYYEFALRYPDTDGKLYSGFIAKSADKIFESTNKIS